MALLLPTFLPSLKWSILNLFHNTEPRDRTDHNPNFYLEGFMVFNTFYISIKLAIRKYFSKNLLRNFNHFQVFRQFFIMSSDWTSVHSELFRQFASEVLGYKEELGIWIYESCFCFSQNLLFVIEIWSALDGF